MSHPEGAFFSYVHADDEHESGRLTLLRERLESEISYQLGRKFGVWQDRNDIVWGQQWKRRIAAGVEGALFFIPLITPRWFESTICREEMELFLKREKALKRDNLILPVIYQQCDVLTDEQLKKADPLSEIILAHQWIDLVPLRFKPFDGADVREKIADMARQLVTSVKQGMPPVKSKDRSRAKKTTKGAKAGGSTKSAVPGKVERQLARRSEPLTLIVDQMPERGSSTTITQAIRNAPAGSRIVIRAGTYREALIIDKPLELIGEESAKGERVIVETGGANCVRFITNFGRIENINFRHTGVGNFYGIDIAQGQLILVDCDITSRSLACISIHHGADPILRGNRIHDGKQGGIYIHENGKGTLENNDIFGNALAGVHIQGGSDPTLRENRIHDGRQGGVMIIKAGRGTLESNDIFANAYAGLEIRAGADPIVRTNRIHDGKNLGVFIHTSGKGTFENNDIISNSGSGILIQENGEAVVRGNQIRDNAWWGVEVTADARGVFESNELSGNAKGNWNIASEAEEHVRRKDNREM